MKLVLISLLLLLSGWAQADCLTANRLNGVNLAGAEFNSAKVPGKLFSDFTYPNATTLDYFRDKGVNLIRLPILWERYQPQELGPLNPGNLAQLKKLLQYAKQNNLCIWIDLHNYALYQGKPLSSLAAPDTVLFDFWHQLSLALADYMPYWAYGLMNEPAKVSRSEWAKIALSVVKQLRASGAAGLIILPGGDWSGAHSWFSGSPSVPSNAELLANVDDPLSRLLIEVHQYADSNYSGTKTDCISAEKMHGILKRVSEWATENHKQLIMGEFGVPSSTECLAVLNTMLTDMQEDAWRGWAYWSAGGWWGNYPFSVQPANGVDKPQMKILEPYLK